MLHDVITDYNELWWAMEGEKCSYLNIRGELILPSIHPLPAGIMITQYFPLRSRDPGILLLEYFINH